LYFCVFCVSSDHFDFELSMLVSLGLFFSVLSQDIGWEERLRNDLFCVEWNVKPYSFNQCTFTFSCTVLFTVTYSLTQVYMVTYF